MQALIEGTCHQYYAHDQGQETAAEIERNCNQ